MENERKINWLGLLIKIIIIFIFILIIIWLVSKITSRTRLSDTFKNNIANMETVATNYFKEVDLPLERGKSKKITLGEMIDKGLIISNGKDSTSSCDSKKSYSEITRKRSNYVLSTTLKCGDEKNKITKKFSLADCKNCTISNKEEKVKENNKEKDTKTERKTNSSDKNSSKNSSNNNSNSNVSTGTTYYEYIKENTTYTKWMKGDITGNNVENKYEYYSIASQTYYSLGVIKESDFKVGNKITYTLKLNNVPNKKYIYTSVSNSSYYNGSEEGKYLKENNIIMDSKLFESTKNITKHALDENNFTYTLSPYYRKGSFYVDVEVSITNNSGVSSYTGKKNNIYYVPIKLDIKFASDEITTNKPSGDYETISYYRYVETTKDVIWSADSSVEGYTRTGNSEIR